MTLPKVDLACRFLSKISLVLTVSRGNTIDIAVQLPQTPDKA